MDAVLAFPFASIWSSGAQYTNRSDEKQPNSIFNTIYDKKYIKKKNTGEGIYLTRQNISSDKNHMKKKKGKRNKSLKVEGGLGSHPA